MISESFSFKLAIAICNLAHFNGAFLARRLVGVREVKHIVNIHVLDGSLGNSGDFVDQAMFHDL